MGNVVNAAFGGKPGYEEALFRQALREEIQENGGHLCRANRRQGTHDLISAGASPHGNRTGDRNAEKPASDASCDVHAPGSIVF